MKHILRTLLIATVALFSMGGLTSCDDGDDGYWWGPSDDNTYYDTNLKGTWQLIQINNTTVTPNETDYLQFGNGGRGYYYYLEQGMRMVERTRWICNAGYYRDTITIRYANGRVATMNYWFTEGANYLYLNWTTSNQGQYTYVYRYVGNVIPW